MAQDGNAAGNPLPRRTFLAGATAGVVAASTFGSGPAAAAAKRPASASRRVAVLGGGVAGLSAAQELAERGFEVDVYERKAWGGKARSIPVPGTGRDGRTDLPGEHGFRFFPGFYQNLDDTMRRIPFGRNQRGVLDNLVATPQIGLSYQGRDVTVPLPSMRDPGPLTPETLGKLVVEAVAFLPVAPPPQDVARFADKIIAWETSGPRRRFGQWEHVGFSAAIGADKMSPTGRDLLVEMFTSGFVATRPDKMSTYTGGLMFEALLLSALGRGGYAEADRVLNAPTNEAWIDPWMRHLRGLGTRFHGDRAVTALHCVDGRIAGATVADSSGRQLPVEADWFVLAVPVERAIPLLNRDILAADPGLRSLGTLETAWMNGFQVYTTEQPDLPKGHSIFAGQPWALTAIPQSRFWGPGFAGRYGDGKAVASLSFDISEWNKPGILYGKTAKECTREQIAEEVLAQMRTAMRDGRRRLPDSLVHSWVLDPAITGEGTSRVSNDEPLLINTPSSLQNRPAAVTKVPNLLLAGDYVRTDVNLATMEGANESGRAAANGVLEASGSDQPRVDLHSLYQPPELKPFWALDDQRYELGLPNQFDVIDPVQPP